MKKLSELTREDAKRIKIVCFDVDGVTVKKGTKIDEKETKDTRTIIIKTHKLTDEMRDKLIELKKHYTVAISSGRSSMYLTEVFYELLWGNTALISEIGIFTLFRGELMQHEKFEPKTLNVMRNILVDLKKLDDEQGDNTAFEPKQFLITLHSKSELKEVYEIVKKYDKDNEFYTIWNGEAFDIAPKRLNKGTGLVNLAKMLKVDIKDTMAVANGPNDKHMLDVAGIGVTTEPDAIASDYRTSGSQHLGGLELIDRLLELI